MSLGDCWSILILRNILFLGQRTYLALLNNSEEGISNNILADRLKTLCETGRLRGRQTQINLIEAGQSCLLLSVPGLMRYIVNLNCDYNCSKLIHI